MDQKGKRQILCGRSTYQWIGLDKIKYRNSKQMYRYRCIEIYVQIQLGTRYRYIDTQLGRSIDKQRQIDRQIDGQIDRQINKDRQIDRQIARQRKI